MPKLDRTRKLSEHFTLGEFISPHDKGADAYWATSPVTFSVRLERLCKDVLEPIRAHFGKAVHVTSGLRSPAHNKSVGGATQSEHMSARAADIWIEGVPPADIALGLHRAIVSRTLSMLSRVGLQAPLVFVGGVARNPCAVRLLAEALGHAPLVPGEPDMTGALGAALWLETGPA